LTAPAPSLSELERIRAEILAADVKLGAAFYARHRSFAGLTAPRRAALEKLQERFFAWRLAFIAGREPRHFRSLYPAAELPPGVTVAQCLRRCAENVKRLDLVLASHCTGWIRPDGARQPFSVDNPELEP